MLQIQFKLVLFVLIKLIRKIFNYDNISRSYNDLYFLRPAYGALSVTELIGLVTLTFDLLTFK